MRRDGLAKAVGRAATRALLLLVAVSPAAGLAACGSAGKSASTAAPNVARAPATTGATTTTTTHTATAARPPAKAPRETPGTASPAGSSGGSASFREPHADNSIPDYGTEAPAGERARATAALVAFLNTRTSGEWAAACAYLGGTTRAQLEKLGGAAKGSGKGCGTALAALSGGGGHGAAPSRAEVLTGSIAALRVKGNSAFALYRGSSGDKYVMPMVKESGAWKVGQLEPLAYPLSQDAR